jgi:hypothetical protein
MAFEGNIDGFMKMFGKSDGTGDYDNSYKGNYKNRSNNRDRHYYQTTQNVDPDTGEVLDFKPNNNLKNPYKMAYRKSFKASGFSMPQPKKILDLAIMGAIGYGAYLLYIKILKPLGNSAMDDSKDKAEKIIGESYVDSTAAAVQNNKATATALSQTGFLVGNLHTKNAGLLHDLMDTSWVDHDEIVKVIKGMSLTTFQLVNSAYGVRDLATYAGSFTHTLNLAMWTVGTQWGIQKLTGTLKFHLNTVLTSGELGSISKWLNSIT